MNQMGYSQKMTLLEVILLLIFSLSLVRTDTPSSDINEARKIPGINYQLPDDVSPSAYKITIIPYLMESNSSFDGKSEIKIKVFATTRNVTLHAKNLVIKNALIVSEEGVKFDSLNHTIDNVTDFLTINFGTDLEIRQEYTLFLEYRGVINNNSFGFFGSSYVNSEGEKVWFAATQFETLGARQAFPCFDEPHLKAKFSISIKHPKKYHALSNMHIIKKELAPDDSEQMWTIFATTPKMSTYLVAFVISDFVKLRNENHDFGIWARKEVIQNGKYASDVGPKILKFIEQYTGIPRNSTQFLKLDNVALPEFKREAMENWGLILYQEENLLVEAGVTTVKNQEFVTIAITHELLHQWFGNLVSPKSWQYIWLNEGLANHFQAFFINKIEPTWQLSDLYIVDDLQTYAFDIDSDVNRSVSINHRVETPDEFEKKSLSLISFYKAGSIFRMISHVLTEAKFQKALRKYLKKMSYKAATPDDLFIELSAEYHGTGLKQAKLRSAFDNWVDTPGFPVITVTRDYANNTAVLTQERFLMNKDPSHNERYWIPINFAQNKFDFYDTKASYWFNPNDTSITIRGLKNNQWAIFNNQHFGYYRVNYDQKNWELIINALNSDQYENIHILNRGQLLNDAFKLAETSRLNWSIALGAASYLKKEKNYIPWKSALSGFSYLFKTLYDTKYFDAYRSYVLDLMEHLESTVGYEVFSEDDHQTKLLKGLIKTLGCNLQSKYCNSYAYSKIEEWLNNSTGNPYPEDYICEGIRNLNQSTWNKVFGIYLESKNLSLAEALACSSNKQILKNYLDLVVNASIPFESRGIIIWNIFALNRKGVEVALDFIVNSYQKFAAITTENKIEKIQDLISHLGRYLNIQKQIDKLKTITKVDKDITEDVIAEGISFAEANKEKLKLVYKKLGEDIGRFFKKLKSRSKETHQQF